MDPVSQPQEILPVPAAAEHDAFQGGQQEVRLSTVVGGGADLLVVEQHQNRQVAGGFGGQECLQAGVAGALVVQPGCAEQVLVCPDQPGRRQVVGHQVGGQHVGGCDVGALGHVAQQRSRPLPRTPHGVEVALRIDGHGAAVLGEVDGQLRHPQQRLVYPHQDVADAALGARVPQ